MPRRQREIPWLEVRDETYYVAWYEAATRRTKRLSLRTDDRVEAQARYAAYLQRGHEIFQPARGAAGLTVSQALDQYWREHVSEKVVAKLRQEVAIRHLKSYFKDTPLREIDIPACRNYVFARQNGIVGGSETRNQSKEGADSTIRREIGVLRAAANHAAKWRRIGPTADPPTPMPSIEQPPEGTVDAPWLTKADLNRAIQSAPPRVRDFMLVAYYTAGRRASVEGLTRFQVDLERGRINLRAPTENLLQRNSKKRRPIVPIAPELRPTIERLMDENGDSEYLFGSNRSMYDPFVRHLRQIGLDGSPHILRHSRATHLLLDGVSLYDVARLLGDTVQTVERVYGHHHPDHMAEVLRVKKEG